MFSILFREQSHTIKVYGAAIVCASQFFLIESFKWDVIEKTVFACRRNYNMQMLLLFTTIPPHFPLMRCDQKSPGPCSLGLGVHTGGVRADSDELGLSIIMPAF